jgi:hypothetical protein
MAGRSLVRRVDPDRAIAEPVVLFDHLPACAAAIDARILPELIGVSSSLHPCHRQCPDKRKRSPRPIDVFSLGRLTLFGVLRLRARQGVPGELISEGVATA